MRKKGQETTTAGGLVAIIAGLLILYILFLPQDARDELLGNSAGSSGGSGSSGGGIVPKDTETEIIFTSSPGKIDYTSVDEMDYDIQAFTLYASTGAKELEKINDFYIRNGWFDKKTKSASFGADDPENTDNVVLSMVSKIRKGVLQIKLNGEIVYENQMGSANPEPIALKSRYLERINELEFSVSGVGIQFWTTNEYSFENVKILADVTDISRQSSKNTFYITEEEMANIEKAKLRFIPDCSQNEVGLLTVEINGKQLFSKLPDCGNANVFDMSPGNLNLGKNTVIFTTDMGVYLIDRIQIQTELEESESPTYYFELDKNLFTTVKDKDDADCGDIDGVCPDGCDEDVDKDCCFEKYSEGYWCDSLTSNIDDRCVGHVESGTCSRCLAGYEDNSGDPPEACEENCGDDTDDDCNSGCSIYYDKDCCFDQSGDQYWCNDLPISGISYACMDEVSRGQCEVCTTGYEGEDDDPDCPTSEEETEEKLKSNHDINLIFEFTDDAEDKEADVFINGRKVSFRTRTEDWEKRIDEYVVSGTNSIKIVPKSDLEVRQIKVELEK